MRSRDLGDVIDACQAIMSAQGIDTSPLTRLHQRVHFTAPEDHHRHWVTFCALLSEYAQAGDLPNPTTPDAPEWAKRISDIVEGRAPAVVLP